jgi:hypothetical protein
MRRRLGLIDWICDSAGPCDAGLVPDTIVGDGDNAPISTPTTSGVPSLKIDNAPDIYTDEGAV